MVTCLLIDENVTERNRISRLLAELSIAAFQTADLEAGIAICRENRPDVVLMDASALPRAKEFLRLARVQTRTTGRPIVILYATESDISKMGESILSGASEFLMVPFDLDLLRFKLEQSGVFSAQAA